MSFINTYFLSLIFFISSNLSIGKHFLNCLTKTNIIDWELPKLLYLIFAM